MGGNISAVTKETARTTTVYSILLAVSLVHLLNDTIQTAIPAMFPILKNSLDLTFTQLGWITFTLNVTSSLLQPAIGIYTDVRPKPYILPIGMMFTLAGVVGLALSSRFAFILPAIALIGVGSAVMHPESSRVAYMASGGKRGLAQSIFQVGGNFGQSLAPMMTVLVFVPLGQRGIIWFALVAAAAIAIQFRVAGWYRRHRIARTKTARTETENRGGALPKLRVAIAIAVLIVLVFSKHVYLTGMTNFYSFYLIEWFGLSVRASQVYLFILLAASTVGTFLGGPLADRFGRRRIIWFSILGTAPFAMLLPYADLFWSGVLLVFIGLILSSAFSVIVVYAQELLPGKEGLVSGMFFGLAFGLGGIGSIALGALADTMSVEFVIKTCAYLPLLGLLTVFLPDDRRRERDLPATGFQRTDRNERA